jgi:hypothetical protein
MAAYHVGDSEVVIILVAGIRQEFKTNMTFVVAQIAGGGVKASTHDVRGSKVNTSRSVPDFQSLLMARSRLFRCYITE